MEASKEDQSEAEGSQIPSLSSYKKQGPPDLNPQPGPGNPTFLSALSTGPGDGEIWKERREGMWRPPSDW